MKMKTTKKLFATLLISFMSVSVYAQVQERNYVLDPQQVPAQPQGYKIGGRTVDKNGVPTFFNGCGEGTGANVTEHGADSHNENGSAGGWTFTDVSLMTPDCNGKGTPDPDVPLGYIQLRENTNWAGYVANQNDPEIKFGKLTSPPVTNIKSLTIQAGSDVSTIPNNPRLIVFGIEASTNGGTTWEGYTTQTLEQQGGRTYTFTATGDDPGFRELATLSQTQEVMIRIIPWAAPGESRGQRLKVFNLSLIATGPAVVTSLRNEIANNEPFFEIQENSFVATNNKGRLYVYNLIGALIGSGNNVAIPGKGLYIVRSENGLSKKVFLQ